ncbi:protein GAMETE EXPRESSED 2, partial [Gastrolobium bilobum]|uniref:protein GAMETE EXPRESSED 2 n=1 Tax=Gastrolobium bilobum TaxID=150636 RepID=UPI002AB3006F
GAVKPQFQNSLFLFTRKYKPSIVVILEPRCSGQKASDIIRKSGFKHAFVQEAEGYSGGIWILWNDETGLVEIINHTKQFVHFKVQNFHVPSFSCTAVYASPREENRKELWDDLLNISLHCNGSWLVAGDFNEILLDLGGPGPWFTWKGPKFLHLDRVFKRLDRACANASWKTTFTDAGVKVLPRIYSDHSPILVYLSNLDTGWKNRPFRFEIAWMEHYNFTQFLARSWNVVKDTRTNLHDLTPNLKRWNKIVFGNIFNRKTNLLHSIAEIQNHVDYHTNLSLQSREKEVRKDLDAVLIQEEILWFQKARATPEKVESKEFKWEKKKDQERQDKPLDLSPYARIPYPQKLKQVIQRQQYSKFLDIFKKLHINIPFVEALENMPNYAKFLKDLLLRKRKLREYETVVVTRVGYERSHGHLATVTEVTNLKKESASAALELRWENVRKNIRFEDSSKFPIFAFSWWDDKGTFLAGDTATVKVKVLENADKIDKNAFDPILTVNGKPGNSSYVSTVLSDFQGDSNNWKISFTPIRVGLFNVLINEDRYKVYDSSLHFQVEPGNMYPSVCVASWKGLKYEFVAGSKATIMVLLKDAFGNSISKTTQVSYLPDFNLFVLHENGSIANVPDISNMGWNEFDYIVIEFVVTKAGNFSLRIEGGNQTLNGSPLPLKVNPGAIDVSNCVAKWNIEPHACQLASKMEIFIHQLDQYGNLVSGLYPFDAEVVERDTNLSIPIADLHFEEVDAGIQLFSFSNSEPGNFLLTIYDTKHNKSISNMPYDYTVFVGYCDGVKSVINGSGLNDSVAGVKAEFSVYLNDIYQYPSPVETDILQVQILRENDSYSVSPIIYPMLNKNGMRYDGINHMETAPSPSIEMSNNSNGSGSPVMASAFHVDYTPEKSGFYNINVYCGNILLNEGHLFRKEVKAGEVNISLSSVVRFSSKVPKLLKNELIVQLMDSYLNPVLSQQSRLKLEIASINNSGFSTWDIVDNKDGSYSCNYMAKDVGTYEICASFDGKRFLPCPLSINVYSSEYFPKANNDTVSIWEDESIAIDALANDYFAGDNASIVEFSKSDHGSLIQNGRIFRYTPYKDYYGNDSFWYTISDINGNLATASVYISVLNVPPQFASVPSQLQATEDLISPRFGGFTGFEITYSNPMENISVNLSAQSGSILLSPMVMQFGQKMWSELTIIRGNETATSLLLEGSVEVINFALQSIQYMGNENFYGGDTIKVSAKNKNGVNSLGVPIFVDPINDTPIIRAPYFIILRSNEDETVIFEKEKDKFDFFIGDPDLLNFPGGEAHFLVAFSMEVNDGLLVTNLPAHLINTTELKHGNNYQWQPLQTYVTISEHFMVKANGIRFQGTVNDCNSVMQQLFYHGGEHGAVLTLTLNDMGNYGCYPDCAEGMSMPLYTEAMINLMRKQPMSSFLAHTLGSIIVIEFVIIFSLGVLLLYFTCKCAVLLVHERRNHEKRSSELSTVQSSQRQTSSMTISENATYFTGCCSRPSLLRFGMQPSNFRQRSRRQFQVGESSKAVNQPSPSTSETQYTVVPTSTPLAIERNHSSNSNV